MSSDTAADARGLRERVSRFLSRNFPQIAMHGGDAAIEHLDPDTGEVWIRLGGACSGCGISPMTIEAIEARMVQEVPEITEVHADAGFGAAPLASGRDGEFRDVPF